jgi:predicted nucleic acid-binding protein
MIKLYLDTNVFFNAYCPGEKNDIADWIFELLKPEDKGDFMGITCELSVAELFRAMKKQVNLGVIDEQVAQTVVDFAIADIGEMVRERRLVLVPITYSRIIEARSFIFGYNLYASDAIYAAVALQSGVACFITFDSDFKEYLFDTPVLSANSDDFKEGVECLLVPPDTSP